MAFIYAGVVIIITTILSILILFMQFNNPEIARTIVTKVIVRIFFIIFGIIVLYYGYHTKNQTTLTLKQDLFKSSLSIVLI